MKYELHSHTAETSQCAKISAKELVEKYKRDLFIYFSPRIMFYHFPPIHRKNIDDVDSDKFYS